MASTFAKEIRQSILGSAGRFIALAVIAALGCGFYAGLRMTAPDMHLAADEYLDATNTYDLRVAGTLGLDDGTLDLLRSVDGVAQVAPERETDTLTVIGTKRYAVRVHELDGDAAQQSDTSDGLHAESDRKDYVNRPLLMEGCWPAAADECVMAYDAVLDDVISLGDTVQIESVPRGRLKDTFSQAKYKVVGFVRSASYICTARYATTSLGDGVVDDIMYVLPDAFAEIPYTGAFVTVEGAREEIAASEAYWDAVGPVAERIRALEPSLTSERVESAKQQNLPEVADFVEAMTGGGTALSALDDPEWYVLGLDKNYGFASYDSDADRIDAIAQVFPFIFFLVTALVSLTTMTRMVDEERILIGMYKALGYTGPRILSKYVLYVVAASGIGCIVGIGLLSQFLPKFIMYAYTVMYTVPVSPSPIDAGITVRAAGLGMGIVLVATILAALAALREVPAALMLPRAPKAGKRILLERVRPLWSRLSFSWKVTARNIFRYKRRFAMAIVGIAGCTALLLTGLGLSNSINDIIDKQYGGILHYNMTVVLDDDAAADGASGEAPPSGRTVASLVGDAPCVRETTRLLSANMLAVADGRDDWHAILTVPEDTAVFSDFVTLRERTTGERLAVADGSAVVSEKLANEMGVGPGDEIHVQEQDAVGNPTGKIYSFTVGGITENYVGDYLYVSPADYRAAFGEAPVYNTLYAVADDVPERADLMAELLQTHDVSTVALSDEVIDFYRTALKSVDAVVVILIVAAALLAFVVLYNLTNINIGERVREIATLKVLGFTAREVDAYIFRETIILSLIGALLGCVLGVWMEGFVVLTAEVDQVMFGRDIHAASFAIAVALTMAFTVIVMLAMRRKLQRISMVESLKSVD